MAEKEPAGMPVLPGKLRPGFQPLYVEIRIYAPLIGSDAVALYCLLLTFRHGGGMVEGLKQSAWPGDRTLCRLLNWSQGAGQGKPSRLARALATLEAAGLVELTTIGQLIEAKRITANEAALLMARTSDLFRRKKRVCLVNDPLEAKDLTPLLPQIEEAIAQRLEQLQQDTLAGSQEWHRKQRVKTQRRQKVAPENNGRADLQAALEAYGVTEGPKLRTLLADPRVTLPHARAWMYQLDSDPRLALDQRVATLICRLEEHARPPSRWLPIAQLTDEQLAWLEENEDHLGFMLPADWEEVQATVGVNREMGRRWKELAATRARR